MRELSIAIHHMVLHLVMAITSVYMITLMVEVIIMSVAVMHTTSLMVQMALIQYLMMAIQHFKLLKLKFTLYSEKKGNLSD